MMCLVDKPSFSNCSISFNNTNGLQTTPGPMIQVASSCKTPLGNKCNTCFLPFTMTVCPALSPPWKRTIISAFSAKTSTIFPLPSSPHWVPTTTWLDIRASF